MNKIACRYEKLLEEYVELAEALQRQTAIQTADQISATEMMFIVSKEKFEELQTAIQRSKALCYLTFDKSRIFLRADADIFVRN